MAAPEATITQYGLANPAQGIAYTLKEACTYPAYIFKVDTTAGQMTKTTAATDIPDGYNMKTTVPAYLQAMVQYTEGSAVAGVFSGIQALIPGQEAYLMLGATAAIAVGDLIAPSTTAGVVMPRSAAGFASGACVVFAKALEAKLTQAGATAGTAIKVRIISPMYLGAAELPT